MSDKYRIDSHKLIYHPERVNEWLQSGDCYPIYIEFGPSGICNHRCTFCGLDFIGYKERFLALEMLQERLPEMGKLGVRSILHSGEGEPLLNKDLPEIIRIGKESGIDQAMATNAGLLTSEVSAKILPHMEWIKVSIAGGDATSYAKIHQVGENEFDKVITNITKAVEIKRSNNLKCTIGMQMLLLPENQESAISLAKIGRDIGVDYLVIKPFSQQLASKNTQYKDIKYKDTKKLEVELAKINTDKFQAIFRAATVDSWNSSSISYEKCLALPFWSHIDAGGNVWGCGNFLHDDRFCFGNLYNNSFEEIWQGEKRKKHIDMMRSEWSTSECRLNCRMDKINRYLTDLKEPITHVNYI